MTGTDRLAKEVVRSHTAVSYVDAVSATKGRIRLSAVDGSVSVDGTATIRRSCSISCVDPTGVLTPVGPHSDLTPYGTELFPYRGVRYDDGTEELVPLGVFRLAKSSITDTSDAGVTISLEAYDRSRTIQREKFTDTYVIAAGTNILDAIKVLVERTFPDVEYDVLSTTRTIASTMIFDAQDDPWEAITTLALSLGCSAYFDVYGRFVMAPTATPDALSSPSIKLVEGKDCPMLSLDRTFSDEPGFNGVIVVGESPGDGLPPVRAEVWDDEPTSPTYRYGPYGRVPMPYTDQNVKTVEDAIAVGTQLLAQVLGATAIVGVVMLVNPAMEAGGVVQVIRARSHVSGLFTAESFEVPMLGSTMQGLTLREKRVVG